MKGAILGDIIGSVYEFDPIKTTDFPFKNDDCQFTDDSVLTIAIADAILSKKSYTSKIIEYAKDYPGRGYGGSFSCWIGKGGKAPYGSYGNGSAMRVSPVAWAFDDLKKVEYQAYESASVTHDHPEGIKGAQAVAACIFLARMKHSKAKIKEYVEKKYEYCLSRTVASIRPNYSFSEICQTSVPEAIICFLESNSVESAIRIAISLGGDADTQACIAGSIAEAFYGKIEPEHEEYMFSVLDERMADVLREFYRDYIDRKYAH